MIAKLPDRFSEQPRNEKGIWQINVSIFLRGIRSEPFKAAGSEERRIFRPEPARMGYLLYCGHIRNRYFGVKVNDKGVGCGYGEQPVRKQGAAGPILNTNDRW